MAEMTKLEQIARLIEPEMWAQYDKLVAHVSATGADRALLDEAARAMLTLSRDKAKAMLALLREPTPTTCGMVEDAVNADAIWQAGIDAIAAEADSEAVDG